MGSTAAQGLVTVAVLPVQAMAGGRPRWIGLSEDVVRQKGDEDSRMMNHLTSRGLLDRE